MWCVTVYAIYYLRTHFMVSKDIIPQANSSTFITKSNASPNFRNYCIKEDALLFINPDESYEVGRRQTSRLRYISTCLSNSSYNISKSSFSVQISCSSQTYHWGCKTIPLSFLPTCFRIVHYHDISHRHCSYFGLFHTVVLLHGILYLCTDFLCRNVLYSPQCQGMPFCIFDSMTA